MKNTTGHNTQAHPLFKPILAWISGDSPAIQRLGKQAANADSFTEDELLAADRAYAAAKDSGDLDRRRDERAIREEMNRNPQGLA